MAVTVTDKGNFVEIDRGEPSRRFVVKPFDVKICGTDIIQFGDGLGNMWAFDIADLTGWVYSDIFDLKDQLYLLNNKYQVDAAIVIPPITTISDKLLQVDSVGSTTYLGYADAGSLTSASVWAIKRIIETGGDASITWADGNIDFDNIWNNRLALTYA